MTLSLLLKCAPGKPITCEIKDSKLILASSRSVRKRLSLLALAPTMPFNCSQSERPPESTRRLRSRIPLRVLSYIKEYTPDISASVLRGTMVSVSTHNSIRPESSRPKLGCSPQQVFGQKALVRQQFVQLERVGVRDGL